MILRCYGGCISRYQDKCYGTSKRVHNRMVKDVQNQPGARCTVCGNERIRHGES